MTKIRKLLNCALAAIAASVLWTASAWANFEAAVEAFNKSDFVVAIDMWEKSAVAGDARSMKMLGDLYSHHDYHQADLLTPTAVADFRARYLPARDPIVALKWYLLAHVREYKFDYEKVFLTPDHYNPHILAGDRLEEVRAQLTMDQVRTAEEMAENVLESGSAYDLYRLGELYERGRGFVKNNVKALLFYSKAKDMGVPEASTKFDQLRGRLNQSELEDYREALDNWRHPVIARYQGETPAEQRLRQRQDDLEALQLQRALSQAQDNLMDDVQLAQRALNLLGFQAGAEDGQWGPATAGAIRRFQRAKNFQPSGTLRTSELRVLFEDAAARDVPDFQYVVGVMYLQGVGVIANGQTAESWLKRAAASRSSAPASQGVYLADYALGALYRDGFEGTGPVAVDLEEARSRFARAWAASNYQFSEAKAALDALNAPL